MKIESLTLPGVILSIILVFFVQSVFAADSHYVLDTGDEIKITVYGEDDLSMETRITDYGVIIYPFIGEIRVKGMTLSKLEKTIKKGLKGDYLINPNVRASIISYRPFYIQGQVKQPGAYPYHPGLTVRRAVSVGGGFTERASRSKIYVNSGDNKERVKVQLKNKVKPGDVITVEESFF